MTRQSKNLYLQIAGFIIKIIFNRSDFFYKKELIRNIKKHLKYFIVKDNQKSNFFIEFTSEETYQCITREQELFFPFYKFRSNNYVRTYYFISYIQFQILLKSVMDQLLNNNNGLHLHASAALIKDKAYLFLAKSGGGKSTMIKLLQKRYTALADDSIYLKKESGKYYIYQTPLIEKESWLIKTNKRYVFGGIFFLKKSKNFSSMKLSKEICFEKLSNQLLTSKNKAKKIFNYCYILLRRPIIIIFFILEKTRENFKSISINWFNQNRYILYSTPI